MFLLLLLLQHGSTYGGNPLGCKVAIAALKVRHLLNGVIFSSFIFMFNSDKFMLGLMGARLHFLVKGHYWGNCSLSGSRFLPSRMRRGVENRDASLSKTAWEGKGVSFLSSLMFFICLFDCFSPSCTFNLCFSHCWKGNDCYTLHHTTPLHTTPRYYTALHYSTACHITSHHATHHTTPHYCTTPRHCTALQYTP